MLERLAGHEYYCFLDGFSGYFQIPIAPEDQEKTTFTCPYGTFAYKRMPFGLCNAPTTFQCCMTAIFHELIEDSMERTIRRTPWHRHHRKESFRGWVLLDTYLSARKLVQVCDVCQRAGNISSRDKTPQKYIQINELDEMRLDAYESSISYKERTKRWYDKRIKLPINYERGDEVKPYQKNILDINRDDDITLDDEGEVTTPPRPPAPQRQEMSVENVSSGLVPQGQKASDYDNSDPVPPRQNVVPTAEKTDSSQQGLEFLFSPLLEEYYNPAHGHAEDNNNDQAPNASFQEAKFINPFCTRV
ncbi:reverse transcriptase domain-containing protein [Tanacetum coccineum]